MVEEKALYEDDWYGELHPARNQNECNKKAEVSHIKKGLNDNFKRMLVARIGKEIYNKLHGESKVIVLKMESEKFLQEIKQQWGSIRNYQIDWLKRNGYKNDYDYAKHLAELNGFESEWKFRFYNIAKNTWLTKE